MKKYTQNNNLWYHLRQILEEERKAIISGKIEALLSCLERKERLLADPRLRNTPIPEDIQEEINTLVKHNQDLLKAGLSFIEEAYQFLSGQMTQKVGYQASGKARPAQVSRIVDSLV